MSKSDRFELDFNFDIVDNMTGRRYRNRREILKLLNDVNDRADRNAELLDVDTVAFYKTVQQLLQKYEIDSLEKLDLILFHQKKW